MQDGRSRVTVVGARRRVDVAVPSAAPIGEYVAGLADLCGQDRRDALPAAWSLAPVGAAPLPLGASLADGGVVDGQVLYLRDAAGDPDDVPVVLDIDETVIDGAEQLRERGVQRGLLVAGVGTSWLVAVAGLLWMVPDRGAVAAATALAVGGLTLVLLGWGLEQRRTALPHFAVLALALLAVPALTTAGGLLADVVAGPALRWPGALAGANLALLLALSATPAGVLIALELSLALAVLLAAGLVTAGADGTQGAAAVTAAAMAMVVLSRRTAALLAVFGSPSIDPAVLLGRTRRLLPWVLIGPVSALLGALPLLGRSGNAWGIALCLTAAAALLIRADQAVDPVEVVMVAAAGAAGLLGAASVPVLSPAAAGWSSALVVLAGLAVVGTGVAVTASAPTDGGPREPTGPPRKRVTDYVGVLALALTAPLALGALGVLGALTSEGRQLFS